MEYTNIFVFVQVFALENPDVDVLNYSPGPVETDMLYEMCETIANPEVIKTIAHVYKSKQRYIDYTEQTINRLVEILKEHKYRSGDHVEYSEYDSLSATKA